jgi:hypothetical protein
VVHDEGEDGHAEHDFDKAASGAGFDEKVDDDDDDDGGGDEKIARFTKPQT